MKAYIFFSIHERLFHPVALRLRSRGVTSLCGFVWGQHQVDFLESTDGHYDPLVVFSRDMLPTADDGARPDLAWLERRERELGVSIQRMLAAERHLLRGRSHEQILRLAEVVLRGVANAYDQGRPDFVFSEDVSCFCSYVHFVVARERGIPFWTIGGARLPGRLAVYSAGLQRSERLESCFRAFLEKGLSPQAKAAAEGYVAAFQNKPVRPLGMNVRAAQPGINLTEASRFGRTVRHYFADRDNPTATPPARALMQRLRRIARIQLADARGMFEEPVDGEKYVVYPIHFQPEASTLVQAPMYVDQLALIQDIAKSLPIGYRLYVKEHVSNRGRRPLEFYEAIRAIPCVRLLGPDVDTWTLIRGASAIAVITGTMGWEGVLFNKPVITFGSVWFNLLPHVYKAGEIPKDGWYALFERALTSHSPDRDATLALVAAMQQTSYPGRIHNPGTFPEVLEATNIEYMADALADAARLPRS